MEKAFLEHCLAEEMTLDEIGAEVGMHLSGVAYWLKKHGLESTHSERFGHKGQLAIAELEALLVRGLSVRAVAEALGTTATHVRYWMKRYDQATSRSRRIAAVRSARDAGAREVILTCKKHGKTPFMLLGGKRVRCRRCNSEAVVRRRRRVKEILVAESGGSCLICGYDANVRALHFHHLDPQTKEFNVSMRGVTKSIATARAEVAKCVLLCSNCHAEVESGGASLPLP